MIVWADTETKSECDLASAGTARYAEHPSTRIQLFSYAFDDGLVNVWNIEENEPMPEDLAEAFVDENAIFCFHNAWFDRNLIENVLCLKIPLNRLRCSMAQALSHGLPGSLGKLGEALGIREDFKKVNDGRRLVLKFCKPKGFNPDGSYKWHTPQTDPEDWKSYIEYCRTDTVAMREIVKKIPSWNYPGNPYEFDLWRMDQEMNSRGMCIDLELAKAALEAVDEEKEWLSKQTSKMTKGDVTTAGQRDEMLRHILEEYGIELPNMQKATLTKLLEAEDTPPALRDLLEVRLSTSTTSTAKYKRIIQATSADGRLRGAIQFAGASRTLRDCLAEGSLVTVLTTNGMVEEKPIEFVDLSDLVWDGDEWVSHEGVVFSGYKNVITHDNICATEEHVVYLDSGLSIRLGEAKRLGLNIWEGNSIRT